MSNIDNTIEKDRDFSSPEYKIKKEKLEENKSSNFNSVFEKEAYILEFEKMIDNFQRNIKFYNDYKERKTKQDQLLLEALRSKDTNIDIDNLLKDDDVKLSNAEIKFLNEIENDVNEANYINNNIEFIENTRSPYKKNIAITTLDLNNSQNKDAFKEYIELKEVFFKNLKQTDNIDDNFYEDINKEQKHRNEVIKNIKKVMTKLWSDKFFCLFYTFDFIKMYKYFKNHIYSIDVTSGFKFLIQKSEWSPSNEIFFYKKEMLEEAKKLDDIAREIKYVEFMQKISKMFVNTLLYEYKDIDYKKSFKDFKKRDKLNHTELNSLKDEIYKLFEICKEKSYEKNKDLFSKEEYEKGLEIEDDLSRENYFSKILQLRIYKLIKKIKNSNVTREITKNTEGNIIDVVNCSKIYFSKDINVNVIKNLNLTVKKGEFVLLLGASGSGKTTLMNMLAGIDDITWGDVVVNNTNLSILNNHDLTIYRKNNVGYIFQRYGLIPNLTVAENIRIGAYVSKRKNIKNFKNSYIMSDDEVNSLLEELDLKDLQKKYPYELSGGQQQRVAIARAIAKNLR